MGVVCGKCGKTVEGEGIQFCPYCGEKLTGRTEATGEDPGAEWVRKAMEVSSYPERKKILEQGLAACPDSREIRWELLFIGEPQQVKRPRTMDFSIIKSWILEIYRKPGNFTPDRRDQLRAGLYDDPKLKACLALFEDPEQKQKEYILRLCREYIEIFLEGDSQVSGTWFGLRIERNKEKRMSQPAAEILGRIRGDEKLLPEQREQLRKAFYQAYAERMGGKTEYLDQALQ